jgi:hypothetical protein
MTRADKLMLVFAVGGLLLSAGYFIGHSDKGQTTLPIASPSAERGEFGSDQRRGKGASEHPGFGRGEGRAAGLKARIKAREELFADLATELGTSAERVEAAFRAVLAKRLEEAVKAGRIKDAQKEKILAAFDKGLPVEHFLFGPAGRFAPPPGGGRRGGSEGPPAGPPGQGQGPPPGAISEAP